MNTTIAALETKPYIFFYGRCDEALAFYADALGGTYEIMRSTDAPGEHARVGTDNGVMHASFTSPGVAFLCSDGMQRKTIDPDEGNICLAVSASDAAYGERIFNALSAGGKIVQPLDDAFWGGRFGMFADRFGIEWMVTTP